jgi:predicted nucleotidyltransferase
LLGVLFAPEAEPMSVGELAERAGVAQATASRELARFHEHGIVVDEHVGRTRLVRANRDLPWSADLQALLAKTVGVPALLAEALSSVDGVREAWVFGSWAERYAGTPGPPPRDIDVLVVGSARLSAVRRVCRQVEAEVGLEINPVVLSAPEWEAADDAFTKTVRSGALVSVPLPARRRRKQ